MDHTPARKAHPRLRAWLRANSGTLLIFVPIFIIITHLVASALIDLSYKDEHLEQLRRMLEDKVQKSADLRKALVARDKQAKPKFVGNIAQNTNRRIERSENMFVSLQHELHNVQEQEKEVNARFNPVQEIYSPLHAEFQNLKNTAMFRDNTIASLKRHFAKATVDLEQRCAGNGMLLCD